MSEQFKLYKFSNREFEVFEPKDCKILVKSKDLPDGKITIHEATGSFREDVLGWGTDQQSLESALTAVCTRMINRGAQGDAKTKCAEMDTFYSKLDK